MDYVIKLEESDLRFLVNLLERVKQENMNHIYWCQEGLKKNEFPQINSLEIDIYSSSNTIIEKIVKELKKSL